MSGERIPKAEAMLRARALREPRDSDVPETTQAELNAALPAGAPALPHELPSPDEMVLRTYINQGKGMWDALPVKPSRIPGGAMLTWRGTF